MAKLSEQSSQLRQPFAFQTLGDRVNLDLRIELRQSIFSRVGFCPAHRRRGMQDLALQIGEIDSIAIGECDASGAARGEIHGCRGAQAASADHQCMCRQQLFLALDADLGQQDMPAVAQ